MKYYIAINLLLLLWCNAACAQADSTCYSKPFTKKNYVQLYSGLFGRQVNIISRSAGVNPAMRQVMLASNAAAFAGVNFKYKKLSLYVETAIPNSQLVHSSNTKVRAYSFFVNQFGSKWGVTGFFNYNKGLLTSTNPNMQYTDRNDLRMLTAGAHVYRIFNSRKFSYLAANSLNGLQLKSRGSLVLLNTILFRRLYSKQSIIPDSVSKYHFTGSEMASKNINLYSLQVRPGYIYNFVFKQGKYFIAPAFYMGIGGDIHSFTTFNERHTGPNINWGSRIKVVGGINTAKYYATVEFVSDASTSLLYQSKIYNHYKECSVNVGWRF
jgi:hypothetical protein